MIPKKMKDFIYDALPESAIQNRLFKEDGNCYIELQHSDEHLLSHLGVIPDKLGPKLVVCMWDDSSNIEIGGYLIVDNLSMGSPSMGGIRMLPTIKPSDIYNLARGMTLKNAAANLPYGGGKAGIVAERGLSQEQHDEVIRGFARLIKKYVDIYVPGPDVGTKDADMKLIAIENGIDSAVSKPADMGGNRIDELGGAAGGVVIALETLLKIMPRLRVLPQFANLEIPKRQKLELIIQGFGAVGAHAAHILSERIPEAKVIGISDLKGYLYSKSGLPIQDLFQLWKDKGVITLEYFKENIMPIDKEHTIEFSTSRDNLLIENAFCMVPAAPVFNYLGVRKSENASMTVDRMGNWSLIVEGANTYSPDPNRKAARTRMEQVVYREKGVMIANDYLVNSGGVIFAAQEHIVKTPESLQIPEDALGNAERVEKWLKDHEEQFTELSKERLQSGQKDREEVIRHNMIELVDMLTENQELLPSVAAERISLKRLASSEKERTAKDIMIPIPTIDVSSKIEEAASKIVNSPSNMVAVISNERLVGVITAWDITRSIANEATDVNLEQIMTTDVITASPDYKILYTVSQLEQHQISAMPVVDDGKVLGLISSDLIAQRYVARLMQDQEFLRL
ncbi:MAG: CBS domain-containing protein [Candidatus Lokiarchaeota archaeon]|nr:CBS domain-containing protein [Candidatus Lokiarchaeota archaeon]MBD3198734.1 CBS domain-containing protein [Candidatus Lokiarchaeota archaeon]